MQKSDVRLLIVDDCPSWHTAVSTILGQQPEFTITGSAFTGEEAILKVRANQPDVVLMDIHLPRINGILKLPGGFGRNFQTPRSCSSALRKTRR